MYRETPPPPALAGVVRCFWVSGGASPPGAPAPVVVPDACEDFLLRATIEAGRRGSVVALHRVEVVGQMTAPIRPATAEGEWVLGVRFPAGRLRALGLPAGALRDQCVEFSTVDRRRARSLVGATSGVETVEALFRRLGTWLGRAFEARDEPPAIVVAALAEMTAAHGVVDLAALARRQGASLRYLQRQFAEWVGVSPKKFARVLRFQRAYQALYAGEPGHLAALADAWGYADQAHMTREFRALSLRTPAALRRSHLFKPGPYGRA